MTAHPTWLCLLDLSERWGLSLHASLDELQRAAPPVYLLADGWQVVWGAWRRHGGFAWMVTPAANKVKRPHRRRAPHFMALGWATLVAVEETAGDLFVA